MTGLSKTLTVGLVMIATLALGSPAFSDAAEHVGEAAYHVDEAVKHSGMGHASMVVEPAEKALEYAKAALAAEPENKHVKMLVDELEKAVAAAKGDDAATAGKHATVAQEHVKMIEDAE